MKKIIYLLPIFLFLTGCNSYIELNELAIIEKIGIEHNDTYTMYVSIIDSLDKDFNINEKTIKVTGDNIPNLISNLSLSLNKKIYFSHLNLLIINDSIKTNEINELINYFLNNEESRLDFLIISSNNIKELVNNSSFEEINNLITINKKNSSLTIYTTMFDIINNYYLNKPIYLSNIEYSDFIKITGLKKIYHNKVESINIDDTLFINYMLNNVNTYKKNLLCNPNKYLYFEILSSNTNNLKNKILITNELKIIKNDCNLDKNDINKLFNDYLLNNLKKITNTEITIKNTIRSYNENN